MSEFRVPRSRAEAIFSGCREKLQSVWLPDDRFRAGAISGMFGALPAGEVRSRAMSTEESEPNLIARAADGDGTAMERLLLAHYDRVHARIARRLPAWLQGRLAPEDVLQQALVDAFQAIPTFEVRDERSFYRWLATIADHRLQDAIKADRAAKRGGGLRNVAAAGGWNSSVAELVELLGESDATPSRSAARHEAISAVQIGLASLSEPNRLALQLRYIQGLPVADVARAMNRTPRAVHNLCYRGLKELHAVLGRSSQYLTRT